MSSGAATAVLWRETAPSVFVLTALRLAKMGRAAEVGIYTADVAPHTMKLTPSPYPKSNPASIFFPFSLIQTSFRWVRRSCRLCDNQLSPGRALCTRHLHTRIPFTSMHILVLQHAACLCISSYLFKCSSDMPEPCFQQKRRLCTCHMPKIWIIVAWLCWWRKCIKVTQLPEFDPVEE